MSPATKLVMAGVGVTAVTLLFIKIFRNHRPNVEVKKDSLINLPVEVLEHIALMIDDPKDLIAMGGTSQLWRTAVNNVCYLKLARVFGDKFLENKISITVAADIWKPLRQQTRKLAAIIPEVNYWTITPEMKAVLKAIKNGTVEELNRAIEFLKDKTELTQLKFCDRFNLLQNPLVLAVLTSNIEIVRFLINSNVPIGVTESGIIHGLPLILAAFIDNEEIFKLLLENGGSFTLKYIREELLKTITISSSKVIDNKILALFVLGMKSLRYERGFKAIRDDKTLAIEAGRLLIDPFGHKVAQLLMIYGIVPDVDHNLMAESIEKSVYMGCREHLEYLSRQGWLDFTHHRIKIDSTKWEHLSLTDYASLSGQYELEEYLVQEKKVPYTKSKDFLTSQREKGIGLYISKARFATKNHLKMKIYKDDSSMVWLFSVIDHYKIDMTRVVFNNSYNVEKKTPLCFFYIEWEKAFASHNNYDDFKVTLLFLRFIEELLIRGVSIYGQVSEVQNLRGVLQIMQAKASHYTDISKKITFLLETKS